MGKPNYQLSEKISLEEALDLAGFGKYSIAVLISCCLCIIGMMMDLLGFTVPLQMIACDLNLSTNQQGLLSAMPFLGIMISSFTWGLCADTLGRRKTLLLAMPVGIIFMIATSFAPSFAVLATLKFLSSCFFSSVPAAAFVLLGESVSRKQRDGCIFIMASISFCGQLTSSTIALPIIGLQFRVPFPWLGIEYTPWRLLLLLLSLPGLLGVLSIALLYESPKFLLSIKKEDEALKVIENIHHWNNVSKMDGFHIDSVYLDEHLLKDTNETSLIRKIWNQTAPLFKPPLLKNSLIIYYLLLTAFMATSGHMIWGPTVISAYLSGNLNTEKTLCEIASDAARTKNNTSVDCKDTIISSLSLYGVMGYSGGCCAFAILVSITVKFIGKKASTLLTYVVSISSGIVLVFLRVPLLSIVMFCLFVYGVCILGNANTYLVELNPTHLRGMANCLSVMVTRGFAFIGVQLFSTFLVNNCIIIHIVLVALNTSGFLVAFLLPPDKIKK